jgi:hypothetical protein
VTPAEVIEQMNVRLAELAKLNLGYPLGENGVRLAGRPDVLPAEFSLTSGSKWLAPMYYVCDGLSFPDVQVGYFVKPVSGLISFDRSSEPDSVLMEREISVLSFGSTGGGDLFVVRSDNGSILLLPPGRIKNRQYDGRGRRVKEVAKTIQEFLELLLADLTAFVKDDKLHVYLATG